MWPIMLAALTTLVFSLPLVPAIMEWKRRLDIAPLPIDADHTLDVASVAAEFRAMLDAPGEGDAVKTDRAPGQVLQVMECWDPAPAEIGLRTCWRVLATKGSLILPDDFTFTRELYATHSLSSGLGNRLLTVMTEGDMLFRHGSVLQRWAYARSAHIQSRCRLLGPLLAQQAILIEKECDFSSLTAGSIYFGEEAKRAAKYGASTSGARATGKDQMDRANKMPFRDDGRWIVEHDYTFPSNIHYEGNLIVHGDLWIGTGAWIKGSVKATGSISLGRYARIDGALMCGGALSIARSCAIMGPVTAEQSINVSENCLIGLLSRPTSLVAPEVCICIGTTVHGTVSADDQGRVVWANMASHCDEHE
ncbi:polymer-forming cytoskeletal protein [Cupriavidus sp. WKF15]|uniref:polymer-forming cytoskeletal protein n=1 Tax=Cupriavidus sp. WKF15 TaxID=3032282 RepID=UPI0023E17F5A|nr:polymer-forming cytoskeletal protein [Cupriavidus sp. WKF15]WER48370.1 polymer-forming cytoskeletal protein [Cupriavidus sp. WKF15]